MGFGYFHIKKRSAESTSPDANCPHVKLGVIFSSGCFVVKAVAFQRWKFRLYLNIMATFLQDFRKGILNLIMFQMSVSSFGAE